MVSDSVGRGEGPAPPPWIRAVLFDLAGTLVDLRDFAGWAELASGLALELDLEELAHAYAEVETELDANPVAGGHEATRIVFWQRVLGRASGREVAPALVERFLAAARAAPERPIAVYSDVRRCLDALRAERRRLGVVANSSSEARVRRTLDRAGILDYFARVVASGTEGIAKPDPEIFRRAVARLGVRADEALFVGDLPHTDALGARAAGLHAIWLHRDGTGLGDEPPEITSLLEVPLVLQQLERPRPSSKAQPTVK